MSPSEKDIEKDAESVETKEVQETPGTTKARDAPRLVLDKGEEHVRYRKRWYQLWYVPHSTLDSLLNASALAQDTQGPAAAASRELVRRAGE